jgi:ribosomal protein S18 acetylase RimI-like enzyme
METDLPADRGREAAAGLAILPATWRDLRPIIALEKICFGADSWPSLEILAALVFPRTVRFKAEAEGEIIGFVIGDRRGKVGWIASIGVHPGHRRRGIGRQLLEVCERQLGTPVVRLSLRKGNQPALQLYQKLGYTEVDVWPRYYRDGEDAMVMQRSKV